MSGRKAKALRRMGKQTAASRTPRIHRHPTHPVRWMGGVAASVLTGLVSASTVSALPEGAVVVSGAGTLSRPDPSTLVIRQNSDKIILNWQGFSIGRNEGVRFVQPGTSSVSLNRGVGQDPSEIFGSLTANGRVFLTNPNGVLFGPSARLDVGSLLATTLQIRDQDFLTGNYKFTQSVTHPLTSVVNEGEITAAPGGFVSFIGPDVMNRGLIMARLGTIALGAAEGAVLDMRGDGLINLILTDPVRDSLVGGAGNLGALRAEGGHIVLSAKVAGDLLRTVVNNQGVMEATSLVSRSQRSTLRPRPAAWISTRARNADWPVFARKKTLSRPSWRWCRSTADVSFCSPTSARGLGAIRSSRSSRARPPWFFSTEPPVRIRYRFLRCRTCTPNSWPT